MAKYKITGLPKAQTGLIKSGLANAKKTKDMIMDLTEDEINEYRKGGYVVEYLDETPKAQKGKEKRNSYLPGAWARTAPDLIEPGQEAFPLPGQKLSQQEKWARQEATYPMFTEADLAWQDKVNRFDENIYNTAVQRFQLQIKNAITESEKNFAESSKYDKISPIISFKSQDITPEMEQAWRQEGFLPIKNKKTGQIDFYLQKQIANRIVYNGLRTDEIVNKLGIGDKEIIEKELGSFMKVADDVYKTGVTEKVLSNVIKKGVSIDQALKDLEKDGYGKVSDIKKKIGTENLNLIEKGVKQHYAYNPAYKPPYLKSNIMASSDYGKIDTSTDLQDKWSDNDIITLARDKAFIDAYDINNFDVTSPNARNDEKWNAQIINKLRSGKWGWKPKTNELIKLEADDAYEPLSIERKSAAENIIDKANAPAGSILSTEFLGQFWDEQDALRKRAQDYTKLGADKFQEKYSPTQEQLQSRWKQGKEAVNIADDASWRAQEMTQKGQRYKYSFEQPYGVDPTTGELITTQVSPDDYAGQTVYLSPEERDKYNKGMAAANMQSVQSHPLYYLPGAIATGTAFAPTSWGGLGLGSSMLNTPIASIPGLTAGNALNAYFGYETLKDEGLAEQAYDAFQKGDIAEGLKNTLYSGLSLAPFAKGAKTLYDVTKGLAGPGMYAGRIATNLPLSASWTNPSLTKGLAIQNPGWSSATKELLPGFTSRFNKALGPQLGQIKLYGTGANPAASSQGLLGNAGALSLPGTSTPIYHNLDDYMGPDVSVPIKYPTESYSPFKPEGQPWQGGNWTYEYDPNNPKDFRDAGLDFDYYKSTLPPYSSRAFSNAGDFNFKPFSEGWLANQRMSNLATYGKQPLLKRSDFATNEEMMIDKLMAKHKGNFDAMMKEAEEEQISPDAVLKRQIDKIAYRTDPALRSERPKGSAPFYLPENWSTSNRATIWNRNFGNYQPFGRELNEFGPMGGKPAISFGESGELDRFYFDQIKKYEDLLAGDANMSPEVRADIQQRLNNIYQKGVKSGIQNLDINLSNPWNYKPGLSGLSPNQYGGELPEAQFGLTKYLAPAAETLSKYIIPPVSQLSKYLTTQTPLQNAYKINPFALKENPNVLLHRVQKPGQTEEYITKHYGKENQPGWGRAFSSDATDMLYYTDSNVRKQRGYLEDPEILRLMLPKKDIDQFNIYNFNEAQKSKGLGPYAFGSNKPTKEFVLPIQEIIKAEKFGISDLNQLMKEDNKFNTPHWWRGYNSTPYLPNPWEHKSGLSGLPSNKYGGLHKAQFGKIIQGLEGMMQVAPRFTKLPSANILNAIPKETHALNKMLGFAAGPQYELSTEDFFTDDQLLMMILQQADYWNKRDQFNIDNPGNPANDLWESLATGNTSRDELFSLLYPNASTPNWRGKFMQPYQEKIAREILGDMVPGLNNKGRISKPALKTAIGSFPKEVPSEARNLKEIQNEEGYLYTADPKMVVGEMRGSLGLNLDDIKNASPEQFEKWRQQIIENIKARDLERYKALLGNPFTAKDAYSKMKLNKYGGSK